MIAVLGGLADVERDLIRTRTAEGRSRAKARGQHMGRPPELTPQQQTEARRRRAEGARSRNWRKATTSAGRRFHAWRDEDTMKTSELITALEEFRGKLGEHQELWADLLDPIIPAHPEKNIGNLNSNRAGFRNGLAGCGPTLNGFSPIG